MKYCDTNHTIHKTPPFTTDVLAHIYLGYEEFINMNTMYSFKTSIIGGDAITQNAELGNKTYNLLHEITQITIKDMPRLLAHTEMANISSR